MFALAELHLLLFFDVSLTFGALCAGSLGVFLQSSLFGLVAQPSSCGEWQVEGRRLGMLCKTEKPKI